MTEWRICKHIIDIIKLHYFIFSTICICHYYRNRIITLSNVTIVMKPCWHIGFFSTSVVHKKMIVLTRYLCTIDV